MNRARTKTINPKKIKEAASSNSINRPTTKKPIARICCLRLRTNWTIRNQFMSSILILNLIFLALIVVSIFGTLLGLGALLLNLTMEKMQNTQLESFKAWSIEESEAITSKIGYYYTVTQYLGQLLQGMVLQDNTLFQYREYPLNQPNSSAIPDLPEWGFNTTSNSLASLKDYYLQNTKALNYFAKSLLTPLEDVPIRRMFASFVDVDNSSILTIGYPKESNFEVPTIPDSLWYYDALRSSTGYSWAIAYEGDSPVWQFSQRFNKNDGTPLLVSCVELNLTSVQKRILDQFNANAGNLTPTLLLDLDGNIMLASSDMGYSFIGSLPRIGEGQSFSEDDWKTLKSIAELQDGDVFTWTNTNGDIYHISASKLNLPLNTIRDTIYIIHFYSDALVRSSLGALSTDIWEKTLKNVTLSGLMGLGVFVVMAVVSCIQARRYLEPLKVLSDYAFMKNSQAVSKIDSEKDVKPIKLVDGPDEIGELTDVFKQLIRGLGTLEKDKEKEPKKADKGLESYPKNFLKGKTMPWKEELKKLDPKLKQMSKETPRVRVVQDDSI